MKEPNKQPQKRQQPNNEKQNNEKPPKLNLKQFNKEYPTKQNKG